VASWRGPRAHPFCSLPKLQARKTSQIQPSPSTISPSVETSRIAELLQPFLATPGALSAAQLNHISMYIDLLLRWNARINLTSIRQPEAIVTRHFGESLFAAQHLFPNPGQATSLIDVGSGAGFPGVAIKLWAPQLRLTLIESNHKKVAFLRQLARTLTLTDIDILPDRAEAYAGPLADVVTVRAVERFSSALPAAARLVAPGGRLALMIGQAQTAQATELLPGAVWGAPVRLPLSASRVLLIGRSREKILER
jgi:16S rRNA (guanine527-N7)-methyltransferase